MEAWRAPCSFALSTVLAQTTGSNQQRIGRPWQLHPDCGRILPQIVFMNHPNSFSTLALDHEVVYKRCLEKHAPGPTWRGKQSKAVATMPAFTSHWLKHHDYRLWNLQVAAAETS